ncbi:D-alanyl-D-alanine carboxypeptidase family protein [Streptomyces sp. NPDC057689]|uniref:D-alanyl-D-alanine carboxypeptidase family protein n=1 Tax=Streptomyces sp. NPDC057689 TaxID=3346213 RepID=UPI0036BFD116
MAGESPDKSEQQQSSGTTRNGRDPRLDVFREPEPPAESGAGVGSAGTGSGEAGAGSGEAGTGEEPASVEPAGDSDGDARADDAAASEAAEPSESTEATDGPESALSPVDAPEEPEDAPEASSEAEGAAEPEADGSEAEEPEADEPKPVAEAESAEAESAEAESAEAESAEADAEVAEPEPEPDAVAEPEAADDESEADEDDSAAEAAKSEPDSPEPAPEEGDARLRAAVAAWVSKTDDDGDSGGSDDSGDGDDADERPRVPRSRDEKPAAEPDETPDATAKPEATAKPDDADADADEKQPATDDEKAPATDDEKQPAAEAPAPVDQPTAVFKAPRLPKVDQPTTALKITRSPSGQPLAAETESLTERTSRFVPLRSDEARPAPAPRKPESPAPAPGAPAALSEAERTRQQPMPPKPPLDLLAELTNTPPPPETPVRTAVRRVKIWTPLVLLLLLVFAIAQMVRPLPDPALTMTAKETYTFGGGELKLDWPSQGQSAVTVDGVGSLGSSGAQKPAPIASVAKIMTAYVILQGHPLSGKDEGEKITVDQQAEDESKAEDESTAPISKGQQFTEKQMLQLLMIPSGNNAARLFARWDASSEAAFVKKMNDEAKKLGMTHTTYTDPSGLKKTTVSTAADQLKLAQAVMKNEVFREIVDTPQIKIDGIDTTIYNNNTILLKPGVSGIKTGSSTPAGGNLIWSANTVVDGKKLWIYGAVMGQQAGTGQPYDSLVMSLDNSLKLIEGAQAAVTSAKVVHKGDTVGYVDDGFGGRTPLVATADLKAKGWPGLKVELSVEGNGKKISRSMKAGTEVGVVTVGSGTGKVSAPVALKQDLTDPTFGQKLTRVG